VKYLPAVAVAVAMAGEAAVMAVAEVKEMVLAVG
jgi:hypothetical protein